MPSADSRYTHFVPARLARSHAADPHAPIAPRSERVEGAAMFADIIGYTVLTETYAQRGPEGIETLNLLLNAFFGRLERIVTECGGDIMSFAGDSVLALWNADSSGAEAAAARALACARRAQDELDGEEAGAGTTLRMRIALVAGEFHLATVGGVRGHWHHVVTGDPLAATGALLQSPKGSIVASPGAWRLIGSRCLGEPHAGGMRVLSVAAAAMPPRAARREDVPLATEALRGYIAAPVLEHLDAGSLESMSEYRRATTLFVAVGGIGDDASGGFEHLQSAVTLIQEAVAKYEGTLTRVNVDDKGANALSLWGLPGRQHQDDPLRAVRAGLEIESGLRRHGLVPSIGISTGRVLCGLAGGGTRYEYSVAGNTVNLAARLMGQANGAVVCDAPTVHSAQGWVDFQPLGRLQLKGRELPCDAFRAVERTSGESGESIQRGPSLLMGRERDRARLLAKLDALAAGEGGIAVVGGEPGIGKTRLLRELAQQAQAKDLCCLTGHGDEIESRTTYFPWRRILQQYLRYEAPEQPAARRRYLEDALATQPRLKGWLALLNDIAPLGFPETTLTRQMSEQSRAEGTSEIVLALLRSAASRRPVVIILDDVQWMDSVSWGLAAQAWRGVQPILLVLAQRSGPALSAPQGEPQTMLRSAERIDLAALSREDTEALLSVRLGVHTVSPDVVSIVYGQSAGNPLFSEEVAMVMRESGHLRVDEDHCALGEAAEKREPYKPGSTIAGVITSRIDLLPPAQKATLKFASVLGGGFTPGLLRTVLPPENGDVDIVEHLKAFGELELVVRDLEASVPRYSFKHGITRDVAYAMLPEGEKRKLHRDIATWYEREHGTDLTPFLALLAHHWSKAQDADATFRYLHLAGEQAVNRFANPEAVEFLQDALELLDSSAKPVAAEVRASCERSLGVALLWMGRLPEARARLQESVALLGFGIPKSRMSQLIGSVARLGVHLLKQLPGFSVARAALTPAERDAAIAMLRLGHIGYFEEDTVFMLVTCVHCLDFAARAEECRESALMLAALGGGAGSAPLHSIAVSFGERALRIAEKLDDPSVLSQALLFSSMYRAGIGDWDLGLERAKRAEELSALSGDNRRREECTVMEAYVHFHCGWCSMAYARFAAAERAARRRGDRQTRSWGLIGMGRARLHQGRGDEAFEGLLEADRIAADRLTRIELTGQLALIRLHRGEYAESLTAARRCLRLARGARPTSFATLTGLGGMTESLLELWSLARKGEFASDARALAKDARRAIDALAAYTRIFRIGSPELLLRRAQREHLLGHDRRALALWRSALAAAERLRMPYEEAKAALAIARWSADREAAAAQERARAIFDRIGQEPESPARENSARVLPHP